MKFGFDTSTRWNGTLMHVSIVAWHYLFMCISSSYAQENTQGKQHMIKMVAEELEGGYLAYRMMQHEITDSSGTADVTSRYSESATMPGPTIVITRRGYR